MKPRTWSEVICTAVGYHPKVSNIRLWECSAENQMAANRKYSRNLMQNPKNFLRVLQDLIADNQVDLLIGGGDPLALDIDCVHLDSSPQ